MAVIRATPADVPVFRIWDVMATPAVVLVVGQAATARIVRMAKDTRAAGRVRVAGMDSDPVVRTVTTMAAVIGTRNDSQTHLARFPEHIAIPSVKSF